MARMGPPDPEWERRRHELPTVSAKDTEEIRRYGLIGVVGGWWLAPLGLGATALDRLPFWPGGLMPDGVAEAAWLAAVAGAAGLVLGGVLLFAIDWAPTDRPRAKRGLAAGAVAALLVWVLHR